MADADLQELVRKAKQVYEERLKERLEAEHFGEFLVIEPESGQYFLGRTLMAAGEAARRAYPQRLTYTMRVGYPAAIEFAHGAP